MDFLELLKQRYATKHYEKNVEIDDKTLDKILECASLTPSALNIQPWMFLCFKGEAKNKIADGIESFNRDRFNECSCAIVIAAKTFVDDKSVMDICQQEKVDGRYENDDVLKARYEHMLHGVDGHNKIGDVKVWNEKQCYIALATIIYAAKAYGLDSTPLEGVNQNKLDELLDLKKENLHAQTVVLLGKASKEDSNALSVRPKSRLHLVRKY